MPNLTTVAAAQAAIVSAAVLVVLTPLCVAILAGLAAVRDAFSGPARQSNKVADQNRANGDCADDALALRLEIWPDGLRTPALSS